MLSMGSIHPSAMFQNFRENQPMDTPPIDNSIDQLQAAHLAAQTARLEAQEAAIRDRLNTPWYEKAAALNLTKAIAQGLFTVMVGLPIVWFYVQNVIEPARQADNLQLKADNLALEIDVLIDRRNLNREINDLRTKLQKSQASIATYQKDLESSQAKLTQTRGQIVRSESNVQQITNQLKQQPNLPTEVIEQVQTVSSELEQTNQAIVKLQATVQSQEDDASKVQEEISKNLEAQAQGSEAVAPVAP